MASPSTKKRPSKASCSVGALNSFSVSMRVPSCHRSSPSRSPPRPRPPRRRREHARDRSARGGRRRGDGGARARAAPPGWSRTRRRPGRGRTPARVAPSRLSARRGRRAPDRSSSQKSPSQKVKVEKADRLSRRFSSNPFAAPGQVRFGGFARAKSTTSRSIMSSIRCAKPDPSYVGTVAGMPISPGSLFQEATRPDSAIVDFTP